MLGNGRLLVADSDDALRGEADDGNEGSPSIAAAVCPQVVLLVALLLLLVLASSELLLFLARVAALAAVWVWAFQLVGTRSLFRFVGVHGEDVKDCTVGATPGRMQQKRLLLLDLAMVIMLCLFCFAVCGEGNEDALSSTSSLGEGVLSVTRVQHLG